MNYTSFLLLFLPSLIPAGEVVITSFPSAGFILRNEPFVLSCTAINAISIRFRCNHKWVEESRQWSMEGIHEDTSTPYLQSSMNISKTGEGNEERCHCYAVGKGERTVKSLNEAFITSAFMRKHFEQTPSSTRLREGSQLALPCVPPLAHPSPTIEWTKNGELIIPDNYLIIASDGSLLLSSARLQDGGNYVCIAKNVAGSRSTPPASIHVYVDGGWSEWTDWSGQCTIDCHQLSLLIRVRGHEVIPTRSRRRRCNNPTPLNGGLPCNGEEEESSVCPLPCSIDGGWSEWERWSECSSECRTRRTRQCARPSPLNGGLPCGGDPLEWQPCSSGICSSQWSLSSLSDGVVLFSLIAVFFLLSILFCLCILILCRQKKSPKSQPYYGEIARYKSGGMVDGMGPPFIQSPLPSFTLMSVKSGYARCESGACNVSRGGESRLALLEGSSTGSSAKKVFLTTTTSSLSEEDNYATVYDYAGGELMGGDCILEAKVAECGGRLSMDKSRTDLLIGEGSLQSPTIITLSTRAPFDDLPFLEDGEMAASSVISVSSCSPSPPRLPLLLSFSHFLHAIDQWTVSLYYHSSYGWDRYEVDGTNPCASPTFIHFDPIHPSLVHCTIPQYGKLLLCARPKEANPFIRMRVSIFTRMDRRDSFPLRVSIVREGSGVSDLHQEDNERLLAESHLGVVTEEGGEATITLKLQHLSPSFVCTQTNGEIDLSSQGSYSFRIERIDGSGPFLARISLQQTICTTNGLSLSVSLDEDYDQLVMREDTRVSLDFLLPHPLKRRISSILDPPSERDWMSLARSLGMPSFVAFGGALSSPTTVLLLLWEARRQDPCHLSHALRLSGRPDVAQMIDKYVR
ncbi:hypothetical protein PMAYCL1PPCAC_18154 [Pristionchus mayeri]|uniref:Netrin receptor UNC5 n=1 Tax=Pristionchus mayeri TaxID=1317129 RepID=A0AAN5CP19_9BILA|nr:hypothetical protein PMAYCL1PPCAC_18154 [Pristionchus mayeri]